MKELILNREVIAVDQDALGVQGKRYSVDHNIEVVLLIYYPIIQILTIMI